MRSGIDDIQGVVWPRRCFSSLTVGMNNDSGIGMPLRGKILKGCASGTTPCCRGFSAMNSIW